MDEVEFTIGFSYKGKEYSGIVRPDEKEYISYVIQYFSEPDRKIEKTINIYVSTEVNKIDNLEWKEQTDEVGQIATDPELVQRIGDAIEDCDM